LGNIQQFSFILINAKLFLSKLFLAAIFLPVSAAVQYYSGCKLLAWSRKPGTTM